MKIVLYVRNSCEYAKLSINAIRAVAGADTEPVELFVFDNASEDGFNEWASAQEDFTYVYEDEGYIPYGKAINSLVRALELKEDFLLMSAGTLVVPGMFSHLSSMEAKEKISLISPILNKGAGDVREDRYTCYEDFSASFMHKEKDEIIRILAPYTDGCLIDASCLEKMGGFDEELEGIRNVMADYGLRASLKGYRSMVDKNFGMWKIHDLDDDLLLDEGMILEKKWDTHYFNISGNPYITGIVTKEAEKGMNILEVGCDMGATLLDIGNKVPGVKLYGIDINETAVKIAGTVAKTCVADIENDKDIFGDTRFDRIIFGDVLEHLRNPEKVLNICKGMLKPGGRIVASIPNLMHISVMKELLKGNFTYTETGLLDKTHVHFFTYNEIIRMIDRIGGKLEFMGRVRLPLSDEENELIEKLVSLGTGADKEMYEAYQYVIKIGFSGN